MYIVIVVSFVSILELCCQYYTLLSFNSMPLLTQNSPHQSTDEQKDIGLEGRNMNVSWSRLLGYQT